MGCDIHLFAEYKVDDRPWIADPIHVRSEEDGVDELDGNRNYTLFGLLANVRSYNDINPEPRGLPSDVTDIIKEESDRWDCDGHSHSYCSLKEFKAALKKSGYSIKAHYASDYAASYKNTVKSVEQHAKKLKDEANGEKLLLGQEKPRTKVEVRFVFWFDN